MSKGKIDYVSVFYSNGVMAHKKVNENLTDKQIKKYFKIGSVVNIGFANDEMAKITNVIIKRKKTPSLKSIFKKSII